MVIVRKTRSQSEQTRTSTWPVAPCGTPLPCRRALHSIGLAAARALKHPVDCRPWAQAYSLFTMSSLRSALWQDRSRCAALVHGERKLMFLRSRMWWWSQTGSNRRPQACKASALPTELWPRTGELLHWGRAHRKEWWAWEDLNFRPHAYQARALTN
jgi:hypothetical protein